MVIERDYLQSLAGTIVKSERQIAVFNFFLSMAGQLFT